MNRLAEFYELYLFGEMPKEQRAPRKAGWWSNEQPSKRVPYAFARSILLTIDAAMLFVAGLIGFTTHAPIITIVGMEFLCLGACVLLLLARICKRFFSVVVTYLAVLGTSILLDLVFPGLWGSAYLNMLCTIVFYRFPPRWALPFAALSFILLYFSSPTLQIRDNSTLSWPSEHDGVLFTSIITPWLTRHHACLKHGPLAPQASAHYRERLRCEVNQAVMMVVNNTRWCAILPIFLHNKLLFAVYWERSVVK